MKNGWQTVELRQLMKLDVNKVPVDAGTEYPMVGVYSFGRGLFTREPVSGNNTSYKFFYQLKAEHVVMSQLFGWEGALALSSEKFSGLYVSPQFPTFLCDEEKLDRNFLGWFMQRKSFWNDLGSRTKGMGDRRRTLNPESLLSTKISIPPLEEQRRIANHVELFSAKIHLAKKLRLESAKETTILGFRAFDKILEGSKHEIKLLQTLLSEPLQNGLSIPKSGIGEHGVLFAKVGIVNSGIMNQNETKRVNIELPSNSTFWMKPNDIFISRGNSLELVGRAAVYRGIPENCAFPDLLIRIRVDKSLLDPQYLVYYLQTVSARKYIESQASGTSSSMKKVSQPKLEKMPIPVPSRDEQRRFVAYLDSVQARLALLRELQSQTQEELDALLPSVLDRAFKGEL